MSPPLWGGDVKGEMQLMWSTLRAVKKFTARPELEQTVGRSLFRVEDRPVFYHGGGFLVYYTPRRFRVEDIQRVEYGEPGEYAVGLIHFSDPAVLKTEMGLASFAADDAAPFAGDILEGVSYASTFGETRKRLAGCQAGETRRLVDGKIAVLHQFVLYGQYELYFQGSSRRARLSGFQFAFDE